AQTSGGLLISLPEKFAADLKTRLQSSGVSAAEIVGKITGTGSGRIRVEKNRRPRR
nr:hypothetical protein [candidate division KSB1 bacterium]NIR73397.1 hypothetical protein [candidate division KSB1 bacterium]NIS28396.1 hypothetical protein [candidate division KSB1 bacterium]NIT75277.1 hypothetical protein [candidate division KSB1 bacterium]NIU29124.1 hypothetical protein [candidate division KSB1 bacterium]